MKKTSDVGKGKPVDGGSVKQSAGNVKPVAMPKGAKPKPFGDDKKVK